MWGDYDGGSGGSGFIQSQGTSGANNQSGVRKGNNSSLLPCAISHVLMAAPGGQEDSQSGGLVVNGVELHTVCVCGIVRGIEIANTNVTYVIDDYSAPPLEIKQWIDPNEDDVNNLSVKENDYIRVYGSVRSFKGVRNIVAFKIEPLEDINELTLHIIETMHAHLSIQKRKSGSYPSMGSSNFSVSSYHSATNMDTTGASSSNNFASYSDQGLTGIHKQLYEMISAFKNDNGISTNEIKSLLPSVSHNDVKKAIEFLSDEGHIYSTIDEDHFKSTNEAY